MTLALTLALAVALAACGKGDDPDDSDGEDSAAEDAEEVVESAGARGIAEMLRVVLVSDNTFEGREREVEVLEENVSDLPGDPEVTGIEDTDGDGLDDDGELLVHVDDEVACVSISESGSVDVHGGEC